MTRTFGWAGLVLAVASLGLTGCTDKNVTCDTIFEESHDRAYHACVAVLLDLDEFTLGECRKDYPNDPSPGPNAMIRAATSRRAKENIQRLVNKYGDSARAGCETGVLLNRYARKKEAAAEKSGGGVMEGHETPK